MTKAAAIALALALHLGHRGAEPYSPADSLQHSHDGYWRQAGVAYTCPMSWDHCCESVLVRGYPGHYVVQCTICWWYSEPESTMRAAENEWDREGAIRDSLGMDRGIFGERKEPTR